MPAPKHQPVPHTEDWRQLQQLTVFPEQRRYKRMRGPGVFGDNIPAHARTVQMPERTLRRDVTDFERYGMISVFRPFTRPSTQDGRSLTPPMRQYIVDCHFEHSALSYRELGTICYVKFGRRPDHHTVNTLLTSGPAPSIKERRYPRWVEMTTPYRRKSPLVSDPQTSIGRWHGLCGRQSRRNPTATHTSRSLSPTGARHLLLSAATTANKCP